MKVVLKRDVKGLGRANEIKNVAEGYARNYLIPRGLAVPATQTVIRAAEIEQSNTAQREARLKAKAEQIAARLSAAPLHFKVRAGETGRLYGSITSKDVAQAIARVLAADFDKRQILLEHPIRDLGTHQVELKLDGGVHAQVRVIVEAET